MNYLRLFFSLSLSWWTLSLSSFFLFFFFAYSPFSVVFFRLFFLFLVVGFLLLYRILFVWHLLIHSLHILTHDNSFTHKFTLSTMHSDTYSHICLLPHNLIFAYSPAHTHTLTPPLISSYLLTHLLTHIH